MFIISKFAPFFSSIDATEDTGRLGRLINHSRKKANLNLKVLEENNFKYGENGNMDPSSIKKTPRVFLIAKREINEGEELLYDYGDRSSIQEFPWLKD